MALVPDDDLVSSTQEEPLPGRAYPRFSDESSPNDFGAQVGEALEKQGDQIQQMHNRTQVIAANSALTDWKNNATFNGLDPSQNGADAIYAQKGQNAVNLPQKYLPQFDQQVQQIASTLTPQQQDAFMAHAQQERSDFGLNINRYEYQEGQRTADIVNQTANQTTIKDAALNWRDPGRIATARDHLAMQASAQAVRAGFAPDSPEAQAMHDQLVGQMHGAVVQQMAAEGNIGGAANYLYQNIGEMDLKQGESLQALLMNKQTHQEAQDAKLAKAGSDAVSKQGIDLDAKGQLTPEWLHANRDVLSLEQYRYFSDQMGGGPGGAEKSNPRVFSDLLSRTIRGDDVSADAQGALLHGQLSKTDYASIVDKVAATRPGYARRGVDYLNQALDPGQLNPDPAAHQSKANALADWDEWVSAHPKADDNQAREAMTSIGQHYAIVGSNQTTLLMRAPRYLVGTRTAPDLPATSAATLKAYQAGEISRDQFEREATLLSQYRSTLKAQADSAAAANAKRKGQQ